MHIRKLRVAVTSELMNRVLLLSVFIYFSNLHIMGQTLSEPVTSKESACCQNSQFRVGSSCMQGWRINMEDSHTHILSLPDDPDAAFFAVYDGHGGTHYIHYVI